MAGKHNSNAWENKVFLSLNTAVVVISCFHIDFISKCIIYYVYCHPNMIYELPHPFGHRIFPFFFHVAHITLKATLR